MTERELRIENKVLRRKNEELERGVAQTRLMADCNNAAASRLTGELLSISQALGIAVPDKALGDRCAEVGDALIAIASMQSERDTALARVKELEEATVELAQSLDGRLEKIAALESRIRELTEWRAMGDYPESNGPSPVMLRDNLGAEYIAARDITSATRWHVWCGSQYVPLVILGESKITLWRLIPEAPRG